MVLIRSVEKRLQSLFMSDELYGSLHVAIGQEATATGACAALRRDDGLVATYRGHGATLAKGASLRTFFAEMYGRQTGCNRGRGGSMLLSDGDSGGLFTTGIVGAGPAIAVGHAMGATIDGSDRVTIVFFGDGATNQGAFHEALNLAGLWKLPVIFFCESNGFAEMLPTARHIPIARISDRAASYAICGVTVDGNDVQAVYDVTRAAVERARNGDGATLIEGLTYRMGPHHLADPQRYRDKATDAAWRARDPIETAKRRLLQNGISQAAISAVSTEVDAAIEDAITFARSSPQPRPEDALENVYA